MSRLAGLTVVEFDRKLEQAPRDEWRARVAVAQQWLRAAGHGVVVDGILGPRTRAALLAAGPEFLRALERYAPKQKRDAVTSIGRVANAAASAISLASPALMTVDALRPRRARSILPRPQMVQVDGRRYPMYRTSRRTLTSEGVPAAVKHLTDLGFVVTSHVRQPKPGARPSAHHTGNAIDIRTRDKSAAEVEDLIGRALALGFDVIDERTRPGQPHVHLQVPTGQRTGRVASLRVPQGRTAGLVASAIASTNSRAAVRKAIRALASPPYSADALDAIAGLESSHNPRATNGRHRGLFQFGPAAWADALLIDPSIGPYETGWSDVARATKAMIAYGKKLNEYLVSLGMPPLTDELLYAAHNQGARAFANIVRSSVSLPALVAGQTTSRAINIQSAEARRKLADAVAYARRIAK